MLVEYTLPFSPPPAPLSGRKMDAYLLLMFFLVLTVLTISIGLAIKMEQKKSRRNQER